MSFRNLVVGAASAALAAALFVSGAHSQALIQAGPTTAGHLPQYFTQGTSQAVVGDAGGAGGGQINANPKELGITSRGATYPVVGGGTGPNGEHFCMLDAPTPNPTGYHSLCFDPDTLVNGTQAGVLSFNAYGAATQIPLLFYINGTVADLSSIGRITVGTTTVANATPGAILYSNNGVLGNYPVGAGVAASLATQTNVAGGITTFPVTNADISGPVNVATGGTGVSSLTLNGPLLGGGGTAPVVQGTLSGTGSTVLATASGALTNGHCVSINSGNFVDAGGACTTGGGGGTVSSATAGQIAYYASSGTVVSGLDTVPFTAGGTPCQTLEQHGGGTSASSGTNVMAWSAAIAALPTNGGCVQFGPGTYSLNQLTVTMTAGPYNVSIYGTGPLSTTLKWGTSDTFGFTFIYQDPQNSVNASGFTMVATNTAGSGDGVYLRANSFTPLKKSTFYNVDMKGDGSGGYWSYGYDIEGVPGVDIYSAAINGLGTVSPAGSGILCRGFSNTYSTYNLNIINSSILSAVNGVQFGNYCQGISLINTTITGGTIPLYAPSGLLGARSGVQVLGGQYTGTNFGIQFVSSVSNFWIDGAIVSETSGTGHAIDLGTSTIGTVQGNTVTCGVTGTTNGIATGGFYTAIVGNVINICNVGVQLLGTAAGNNVQSNIYNTTTKAANASATANNFGSCVGVSGACTAGATP